MERLLPEIRNWFEPKTEHLQTFACMDSRVEGWFKGELLVLFGRLLREHQLSSFEREANVPISATRKRTQVDFRIGLDGDTHLCELKALCISQAGGTPRNLQFYCKDDQLGLVKDFRKLDQLESKNKWALAFVYPKPSEDDWNRAVDSLVSACRHWKVVTPLSDASDALFIALWHAVAQSHGPQCPR